MFDKIKTSKFLFSLAAMALMVFCVAFLSVSAFAQDGTPAQLTNKDIGVMSKSGVPDAVIFAKIKASPTNFDTSINGLQELKLAGVSDAVVLAMMPAAAITSVSTKIPATQRSLFSQWMDLKPTLSLPFKKRRFRSLSSQAENKLILK